MPAHQSNQFESNQIVAPAPVYSAPAPVYSAPAPVYSAPAPVYSAPVKGYNAPRAAVVAAPVAPVYAPAVVEAETPRAFSYSFGATHLSAPTYAAPAPIAVAAPAPVYQQRLEY